MVTVNNWGLLKSDWFNQKTIWGFVISCDFNSPFYSSLKYLLIYTECIICCKQVWCTVHLLLVYVLGMKCIKLYMSLIYLFYSNTLLCYLWYFSYLHVIACLIWETLLSDEQLTHELFVNYNQSTLSTGKRLASLY